jgi:hypothetical protein
MHYCFQVVTFWESSSHNSAGISCLPNPSYMLPIITFLILLCQQHCTACVNYVFHTLKCILLSYKVLLLVYALTCLMNFFYHIEGLHFAY